MCWICWNIKKICVSWCFHSLELNIFEARYCWKVSSSFLKSLRMKILVIGNYLELLVRWWVIIGRMQGLFLFFWSYLMRQQKLFSTSQHVSMHTTFNQVSSIYCELKCATKNLNLIFATMDAKMMAKYNKYWGNC